MLAQSRQAPRRTALISESSSDEEDDLPNQQRQHQPLSTRAEQLENIRQLQAKLNELEGENEKLKLTIAQGKRQRDTSSPDSKVLLMQFAKKFCFTGQLWLQSSPHCLAQMKAPAHFDRYSRYVTTRSNSSATPEDQAEKEATAELWEILQVLPEPMEGLDLNKALFERMGEEMSDFRSHLQNRVRGHRALLLNRIGDLTGEDLLSMEDPDWRFQNPKVRKLAGFSVDPEGIATYAFMPPILLDNNEYEETKSRMFRNVIIERILVLCLMGPASLKNAPPYKPSAKVNCRVWGVKAVNGNMVAAAAVLARFLLSSDAEFTKEKRLAHGVDWKKTFFEYKALLWNDRKPSVRSLLQDLNNKLFGQEHPVTHRRRSFSPIVTPNPEFVSLATALDEEDEPAIDAQAQARQPRELTTPPLNLDDDTENDDFEFDLDATRSTAPVPPLASAPNGLSLLAEASLTVSNEIPASETRRNPPVITRPVSSQHATTVTEPSTVVNSSRSSRPAAHFEGEYVESSETEDDRPTKARNIGKKPKQKRKAVPKENAGPQPAVVQVDGMVGAAPKRKRGRPRKETQSSPPNADAI